MNAQSPVISSAPASLRADRILPKRGLSLLLDWRAAVPWWYDVVGGLMLAGCAMLLRMELFGATHKYAYTISWPFVALAALVGRPAMGAIVIVTTATFVHTHIAPLSGLDDYLGLFIYVASGAFIVLLNDTLARTRATARDDSRRAQAAEQFSASLVESSNDAIITRSLDGLVTSWNPAAHCLFGYAPAEMIGKPMSALIPNDAAGEEAVLLDQIRRGEAIAHYQTTRIAKDGRTLHVSITVSPIRDENGAVVGASKILRDVTAERQTTDALRANELLLRCALDGAKAGAWSWDCVKMQSDWSPRYFELHGLDAARVEPSFDVWLAAIVEEDRDRATGTLQEALQGQSSEYHDEYRVNLPGGESRWLEIFGHIDRNEDGAPLRIAGIAIDVTERHRAVEELERSNQDLARANESLKKFSYIAAHDLQEPLRKIEQFGDMFANDFEADLTEDGVYYLKTMRDSARRMRVLINDLLAFARAGNRPLAVRPLDTNALMQNALAACSTAIGEAGAVVDVGALPPLVGDEGLVESLFRNFVTNAVKYRKPRSAPSLSVRARKSGANTFLDFADEGVGIAPEHQQIIFEPFTRLNPRETDKGSGIGLAFCRTVCERHGWRLTVASEPDLGAIFSVEVPSRALH